METMRRFIGGRGSFGGVGWWAPRLSVLALSTVLFASMGAWGCGDDDDELCDYEFVDFSLGECEDQADEFLCLDFDFDEDNGVCSLTDCICADDDDAF